MKNNEIIEYTRYSKKKYRFKSFLGIDPRTGKKIEVTRSNFDSKREAKTALSKLIIDYDKGLVEKSTNKKITFREVADEWKASYVNTVKPGTYFSTMKILDAHVLKEFGDFRIVRIDIPMCQKIINDWAESRPKSFKKWMYYVSKILNYAVSRELIQKNPMKYIVVPNTKLLRNEVERPSDIAYFYSKEELKQFLKNVHAFCVDNNDAHSSDWNYKPYVFFHLLAFSGMRKGEAMALLWSDIHFLDQTISITKTTTKNKEGKTISGQTKTKAGRREIYIDDDTLKILKDWRARQKRMLLTRGFNANSPDQLVFNNFNNGFQSPTLDSSWRKEIYATYPMERKINTHGLRHTHASLLFESGSSIKDVQERLGHSDINTTMQIYVHVTENQKKKSANKFADFMSF